jgi:U3 small nucleolar RNA-associated protein 14
LKKASTASKRAQNIDDDEVNIEVDGNVLLRKQSKKRSKADAADGDNSGDERDELMPNAGAFKQRDLVAEAFAGDNVVEVSTTPRIMPCCD